MEDMKIEKYRVETRITLQISTRYGSVDWKSFVDYYNCKVYTSREINATTLGLIRAHYPNITRDNTFDKFVSVNHRECQNLKDYSKGVPPYNYIQYFVENITAPDMDFFN